MNIELNRKKLKQLAKEEGHTLFEQALIRYALKLHERMALNNAHESELLHKAKSAFETLQKIFTPPQDLCQDDGVNWKEVAIRYKQEAEQWKEENHKNLIDVNRLLIEKDNHLNEIKRLGAELYKANLDVIKNRSET
jgi:hypothetical protein